MLHVRPSRDLRNSFPEISKLVKNGDRVVITVNGTGEGVYISMKDYNEYEALCQDQRMALKLKERMALANSLQAEWIDQEEALGQLGL